MSTLNKNSPFASIADSFREQNKSCGRGFWSFNCFLRNAAIISYLRLMTRSRLLVTIPSLYKMPKKNVKSKASVDSDKSVSKAKTEPVDCDKDGNILIHVHAKPGSKQNMIQGSETSSDDQPRLAVKIAARAVEGQANTELVEYLAEVLSVRKSDFSIVRGQKSREKTVSLSPKTLTLETARKKIEEEIARTKDAE